MAGLGSYSQGGLGFGLAFTLEDKFSQVADKIDTKMGSLSQSAEQMQNRINSSLKMVGTGLAMVGAGAGILSFFGKASDIRAEYQAYEVQFETLLQSKQRAADMMAKIKLDAGDNPVFGSKGLVSANAALLGTGKVMEDQSRRITNNLANIIAGVGGGDEELQRMAVNLAQIGSLGKAQSQDIKQFIMAGIPIYKVLEDGLGMTQEQIEKTGVSLEMLDTAFAKASAEGGQFYKATERAAQSTKGLKAAADDARELIMEGIGKAIEPYTRKLYGMLNMVLNKVRDFVNSPLGSKIAGFTVVLGGLLVVGGLLLIMLGGMRLALTYITTSLAQSTIAMVLNTFATQGLAAGFGVLGTAIWTALAPLLPIIAVIALVTGAVYGLYKGFENLNGSIEEMQTTGLIGWFTKIAGTIEAVRQIWSSWNGETFTLTEDLAQRLEKLGIMDFVMSLSTAVVRIKNFFSGVAEGFGGFESIGKIFKEVFAGLSPIFDNLKAAFANLWETVKPVFAPIVALFNVLWEKIFGTSTSLKTWKDVGVMVGKFLIGVIRFIIEAIAGLVLAITWIITKFAEVGTAVIQAGQVIVTAIIYAFRWAKMHAGNFFNWIFTMPARMMAWGIQFVSNIIIGIQTKWGELVSWIDTKVTELGQKIANGVKSAWDFVKTGGGLWGDPEQSEDNPKGSPKGTPTPINTGPVVRPPKHPVITSKSPAKSVASNLTGSGGQMQPIIIQNVMDGDVISERVYDRQTFKNSRNA